jgi:hypothetical protein
VIVAVSPRPFRVIEKQISEQAPLGSPVAGVGIRHLPLQVIGQMPAFRVIHHQQVLALADFIQVTIDIFLQKRVIDAVAMAGTLA